MEGCDLVDSFLPGQNSYKIICYEVIETASLPFGDVNFDLQVRVNVRSEEEVKLFLSQLNDISG